MITDTKRIGNSTELNCIAYLYNCGCDILLPYGDSQKYDIVIDYNNKMYKIQCKTGNPSFTENGEVDYMTFKTSWESGRKARKRMAYTKDDIDFFATFYNDTCYLIPVEEAAVSSKVIRFLPPRNGQKNKITFANEYKAELILQRL